MAISPSVFAAWIRPGAALTTVFGLADFLWAEIRGMRAEFKADIQASEARRNKRIDELKDDMKEIKADIKALLLGPECAAASRGECLSPRWRAAGQTLAHRRGSAMAGWRCSGAVVDHE